MDFTSKDIGCYGDGCGGWQHVRDRLATLVEPYSAHIAAELLADMSDDASEEDEALILLQAHTEPGMAWAFIDGDLLLLPEDALE